MKTICGLLVLLFLCRLEGRGPVVGGRLLERAASNLRGVYLLDSGVGYWVGRFRYDPEIGGCRHDPGTRSRQGRTRLFTGHVFQ